MLFLCNFLKNYGDEKMKKDRQSLKRVVDLERKMMLWLEKTYYVKFYDRCHKSLSKRNYLLSEVEEVFGY